MTTARSTTPKDSEGCTMYVPVVRVTRKYTKTGVPLANTVSAVLRVTRKDSLFDSRYDAKRPGDRTYCCAMTAPAITVSALMHPPDYYTRTLNCFSYLFCSLVLCFIINLSASSLCVDALFILLSSYSTFSPKFLPAIPLPL